MDEQLWEWTSTTAQPAENRSSSVQRPSREKKRPQPAASTAGRRSKGEWEQLGPLLVEPGNAAVKTEGSGSERPVKPGLGDRHFVPRRGSVVQPDGVTLASRSVAVQTEDSSSGRSPSGTGLPP